MTQETSVMINCSKVKNFKSMYIMWDRYKPELASA